MKSSTGIYHAMMRGINQQMIFQDYEDSEKFLSVLAECKEICNFKLHAYCLMGNHVHLLIQERDEPLDLIFKRIGSRYVYWYNIKYKRVGHLFQDRYKSQPVENDEYFLSVLRYIHHNPVKAKLVEKIEEYKFSSYNCYFDNDDLVDKDFALSLISNEKFVEFHKKTDLCKHLDIEENPKIRITDEDARRIIQKYTNCKTVEEYQKLSAQKQREHLADFRQENISIRQINKLTGVAKSIIERA